MSSIVDEFFTTDHYSGDLKEIAELYSELRARLDVLVPDGSEKEVSFRDLLNSRDSAIRGFSYFPAHWDST